ncbi:hypothetical protein GOV04_00265 [Candidatus Woesearchaeota archaeon]|nr:hypothetical protein [Candidatus Woesearchaeota archaeon]
MLKRGLNSIIVDCKNASLQVRLHYEKFFLIVLADLLFFFNIGFFSFLVKEQILKHAFAASQAIGSATRQITADEVLTSGLFSGFSSGSAQFNIILLWFLFLAIGLYLLFVLFQGFSFKQAVLITDQKPKKWFSKFAFVNLYWFGLFIAIWFLFRLRHFLLVINKQATVGVYSLADPIVWLFFILYAVLFYVALISYHLLITTKKPNVFKESFKQAFTNIKYLKALTPLLVSGFIIFIIDSLLGANFLFQLLIVLPFFAWARINFFNTVK